MAKTTVADLEKAVIEQHQHILALTTTIATLTEGVALLNKRLDDAARVVKSLQVGSRPTTRVQPKPQANPWFVAINQIRRERGLAATAWVDRAEVLARMELNAAEEAAT